jgi:hypothetical protein
MAATAAPPECTAIICLLGVATFSLRSNKYPLLATTNGPDYKHSLQNKHK